MAAPEPAVAREYNAMKNKFNTIAAKINELEAERNEHALVVASMEKLEAGRRCFRLVSGVLVERTVGEVLPAVRKNLEGVRRPIPCRARRRSPRAAGGRAQAAERGAGEDGEGPDGVRGQAPPPRSGRRRCARARRGREEGKRGRACVKRAAVPRGFPPPPSGAPLAGLATGPSIRFADPVTSCSARARCVPVMKRLASTL